jgi:hypothetical protein
MQNIFTLKTVLIISLIAYSLPLTATIRYVSHTGSSTPPYTTWETAADSIQKCINYSVDGDTIIVANGVYYESLIVNKYLWLIGSSMDSTIIDGTGLDNETVDFQSDGFIENFWIIGKGQGIPLTTGLSVVSADVLIMQCKVTSVLVGIGLVQSSSIVNHCFILNVNIGYESYNVGAYNPLIRNSIVFVSNSNISAINIGDGTNTTLENYVLGNLNSSKGIGIAFGARTNIINNNTISGFNRNIDGFADDTAISIITFPLLAVKGELQLILKQICEIIL